MEILKVSSEAKKETESEDRGGEKTETIRGQDIAFCYTWKLIANLHK